jgi:putative membrane protein
MKCGGPILGVMEGFLCEKELVVQNIQLSYKNSVLLINRKDKKTMENFILRTIVNGFALYAAVFIVPGIVPENPSPISWVWLAVIFGLLNALVRPLLKFLSCGVILLTLGLFTLVINTALFYLTGWMGSFFGAGLLIENFWAAFFGALIVSIISFFLNTILKDEKKNHRNRT